MQRLLALDPSIVGRMQQTLLSVLIFQDMNSDLIDDAADLFLPLVIMDQVCNGKRTKDFGRSLLTIAACHLMQNTLQDLAHEIINHALNDAYRESVMASFQKLMESTVYSEAWTQHQQRAQQSRGAAVVINSEMRHSFRKAAVVFVSEVRCYVRLK